MDLSSPIRTVTITRRGAAPVPCTDLSADPVLSHRRSPPPISRRGRSTACPSLPLRFMFFVPAFGSCRLRFHGFGPRSIDAHHFLERDRSGTHACCAGKEWSENERNANERGRKAREGGPGGGGGGTRRRGNEHGGRKRSERSGGGVREG